MDRDLRKLFGHLRAEDQQATPDFHDVLARARRVGADPLGTAASSVPWWRAIPLGECPRRSGHRCHRPDRESPDRSEASFREAVRWTDDNPLFASVGVPSDALLDPPEWAMLKTGKPIGTDLGAGLSRLLGPGRLYQQRRGTTHDLAVGPHHGGRSIGRSPWGAQLKRARRSPILSQKCSSRRSSSCRIGAPLISRTSSGMPLPA